MTSIPRALITRLARLEAQSVPPVPQRIMLVYQYADATRETALQAAGLSPEEVSGSLVVFLQRPPRPSTRPSRSTTG